MPFAPKIRKKLIGALEEHALPMLKTQLVSQLLAAPPFDFGGFEMKVLHTEYLPDNAYSVLDIRRNWPDHQLLATRGLRLEFIYSGSTHRKVGIRESHAAQMRQMGKEVPPAVQILKTVAPVTLLYADYCPRESGGFYSELAQDSYQSIMVFFDKDITLSHTYRHLMTSEASHRLQISDQSLLQLADLYYEDLCHNSNRASSQNLLLAIMQRLHFHLLQSRPAISNSCWLEPVDFASISPAMRQQDILCLQVVDYIQNHLNLPLTVGGIAQRFEVSGYYLNQVFAKNQGTTLKKFITHLRIKVACEILSADKERISDVASLVGYQSQDSFGHSFKRITGVSPSKFRQRVRKTS